LGIAALAAIVPAMVAVASAPAPSYGIAFASFAPLNTDIFVADADG
jgi:hypothetical protein